MCPVKIVNACVHNLNGKALIKFDVRIFAKLLIKSSANAEIKPLSYTARSLPPISCPTIRLPIFQ